MANLRNAKIVNSIKSVSEIYFYSEIKEEKPHTIPSLQIRKR